MHRSFIGHLRIGEHISDISKSYADARAGKKGDELAAAKAEWMSVKLGEWATKLEACLKLVGGTGFAVGNKVVFCFIGEYY
jgi:hypothetical protein